MQVFGYIFRQGLTEDGQGLAEDRRGVAEDGRRVKNEES